MCYCIAISNKKSNLLFKRVLCREYGFSTKHCCGCYCSICSHSHEGRLSDLERNLYRMMIRHVIARPSNSYLLSYDCSTGLCHHVSTRRCVIQDIQCVYRSTCMLQLSLLRQWMRFSLMWDSLWLQQPPRPQPLCQQHQQPHQTLQQLQHLRHLHPQYNQAM